MIIVPGNQALQKLMNFKYAGTIRMWTR